MDYKPVTETTANSTAGAKLLAQKIETNVATWVKGELETASTVVAAIDRLTDAVKGLGASVPPPPPVVTPVDPPAPPAPPPAAGSGLLLHANFNDGTASGLQGLGGEIKIIPDPTASGRGNVLSLEYALAASAGPGNVSVDRGLRYHRKLGLGESLFFKGDVYFDVANLKPQSQYLQRKLLYWRGDGGPLFNLISSVVKMTNDGIAIEAQAVGSGGYTGGDAGNLQPRKWHTVELETTMPSVCGKPDGKLRLWVDGMLRLEDVAWAITHAGWIGAMPPGGGGIPGSGPGGTMTAADIAFHVFMVGEQVTAPPGLAFSEKRYWDNITFATKRIAS